MSFSPIVGPRLAPHRLGTSARHRLRRLPLAPANHPTITNSFTSRTGNTIERLLVPIVSVSTMSSVAQKRLFHEYKNLSTNPPDGITAGPVIEDDMYYWEALIQGPEGTPFEGGVFAAEMKFPKDYPLSPPTMKFVSGGVWHPNGRSSLIAITGLYSRAGVYSTRWLGRFLIGVL